MNGSARLLVCALLLGATHARAGKIVEYTIPTPNARPEEIAVGADGRIWFTEPFKNQIGAVTVDGVFTEYPTPSICRGLMPVPVLGALHFTEQFAGRIGVIQTDGSVFELTANFAGPQHIVAGPDGRGWFTQSGGIYAYHNLAGSPPSEAFPAPTENAHVGGIALGPDGRIWFTELIENKIGACSPDGAGCVEYAVPYLSDGPVRIVAGPDDNLWFTLTGVQAYIAKISTHGEFLGRFPIPTLGAFVSGITAGPDGNVWFAEPSIGKIGRITPAGVITEYTIPTPNSEPIGITTGPDGNIWFTEASASKIGKLRVFVPGDVDDDGDVTVFDVFYLINFLFAGGPVPK
jgi:streptogramin lyase